MKRVEGADGKLPLKETMPELCLVFAESALQLVAREAVKEVVTITQQASDASFAAGALHRHMKQTDNRKRILGRSRKKGLTGRGCARKIVETGSQSLVSGATVYKKSSEAGLQRQMEMRSSQDGFFSSQDVFSSPRDVPEEADRLVGTMHGPKIHVKIRKRVMALRGSALRWNSESSQCIGSLLTLIQLFSDKAASSLRIMELVAHPASAVWLNVTKRRRRYPTDLKDTFLELLSAGISELGVENGDLKVHEAFPSTGLQRSMQCSWNGLHSSCSGKVGVNFPSRSWAQQCNLL